jgi:uncharacterized membrane protein YkoI
MRSIMIVCAMLAATLGGASSAGADPSYRRDVPAKLAAEAKISESAAVATAQRSVPNSTVVAVELEREHQTLLYSVDLQVPGQTGVTEVEVDANDGKVLASEHESAREEDEDAATPDEDDDEDSQPH